MKISGPASVAPGADAEYTASGGLEGCSYRWDADRGRIIDGTYTAPDTPGSDRITVSPYLCSDMGKICAYKDITIEGGCKGTVHATTLQMTAGASQNLYITGGSEGDIYHWSTTSGSLSPSTGTSVTYTAPATNPNCVNNPTITVTCGGSTIGTLTIAVNAYTANVAAYNVVTPPVKGACCILVEYHCNPVTCEGDGCGYIYSMNCTYYSCDGSINTCSYLGATRENKCTASACQVEPPVSIMCTTQCTAVCGGTIGAHDNRTSAQKLEGCCPAALL
jgi:hypothetical protein